jgi:hypothetical protein
MVVVIRKKKTLMVVGQGTPKHISLARITRKDRNLLGKIHMT